MLKKTLAAVLAALFVTGVWASCRSYTVTINGKTLFCTECCYSGHCNTTCI